MKQIAQDLLNSDITLFLSIADDIDDDKRIKENYQGKSHTRKASLF